MGSSSRFVVPLGRTPVRDSVCSVDGTQRWHCGELKFTPMVCKVPEVRYNRGRHTTGA